MVTYELTDVHAQQIITAGTQTARRDFAHNVTTPNPYRRGSNKAHLWQQGYSKAA